MAAQNLLIAQAVESERLAELRKRWPEWTIENRDPILPGSVLPVAEIADRTVLFTDHCPANVDAMPALRWIQLGSAGYQQLAGLPLPPGVRVSNASGVNDIPIAEWCVLMMLSFVRDLPDILRRQAERDWARPPRYQSELRGRRVGIYGYGGIGREVARLSQGLGLEVWALSRSGCGPRPGHYRPRGVGPDPAPGRCFSPDQLPEFLSTLDFLVVTAPLTAQTRGRFGAAELAMLPRHAVVLNPARAHIVDEAALVRALQNGDLAGAAFDSHYREPMPPDDPFWRLPNTVVTPHVSGSTESTHFSTRLWDLFEQNLERFDAGQPLLNEIPPDDYRSA